MKPIRFNRGKKTGLAAILLAAVLAIGTWRNPDFWFTANQRGDWQMKRHHYGKAEATFSDPWRIGVAQYREGKFEDAARTFRRVPGVEGAYNSGNASLMHGNYDDAIAQYDRALAIRSEFQNAKDNRSIAIARRDAIHLAGKDAAEESEDTLPPDKVAFDLKSSDTPDRPKPPMRATDLSDEQLRATWLRRVKTTPADFLKAKFAWQAMQPASIHP